MLNLSMSLRSGEGVAQADVGEAFRWLKSSAEAGSDRAQFNVGVALDPFHPPYGKPGEVDPAGGAELLLQIPCIIGTQGRSIEGSFTKHLGGFLDIFSRGAGVLDGHAA